MEWIFLKQMLYFSPHSPGDSAVWRFFAQKRTGGKKWIKVL